jgi:hypothetical protein
MRWTEKDEKGVTSRRGWGGEAVDQPPEGST